MNGGRNRKVEEREEWRMRGERETKIKDRDKAGQRGPPDKNGKGY